MGVLFLFVIFLLINQVLFGFYESQKAFKIDKNKLNLLYLYHSFFFGIYLWYASLTTSDSFRYFSMIENHEGSWLSLFGTDTSFIHFVGYPFYLLGSSYEMVMFIFSWFGYLGFFYAYLFFKEKIPVRITVLKMDLLTALLFLPNMHFWTVSLGKGSLIFLGLMMFTYAITKPKSRLVLLILGAIIIFFIRPHVFLFVALGAVLGYMSGKEKIPVSQKLFIFISLISVLILVQDQILAVADLQKSENIIDDFEEFASERASNLASSGSGVDISSYPLPLKLFTFWFRPLFFDAPNFLGIIVSFENLFYLFLFLKILNKKFFKFIKNAPSYVKMSLVIFLTTSFAMTFVTSNLGIIMRQKSMIMYYLFFVIYYFLAEKKYKRMLRIRELKAKRLYDIEVVT